jgi:hypothetical protein
MYDLDLTQDKLKELQLEVCRKYGATPVPVVIDDKVGISRNVRDGILPINGLRVRPEGGTCGWYIWAGENMSDEPDFFEPLHASHLQEWCEPAVPFLLLPPGWRFLIAGDFTDAWFDPDLDLS